MLHDALHQLQNKIMVVVARFYTSLARNTLRSGSALLGSAGLRMRQRTQEGIDGAQLLLPHFPKIGPRHYLQKFTGLGISEVGILRVAAGVHHVEEIRA